MLIHFFRVFLHIWWFSTHTTAQRFTWSVECAMSKCEFDVYLMHHAWSHRFVFKKTYSVSFSLFLLISHFYAHSQWMCLYSKWFYLFICRAFFIFIIISIVAENVKWEYFECGHARIVCFLWMQSNIELWMRNIDRNSRCRNRIAAATHIHMQQTSVYCWASESEFVSENKNTIKHQTRMIPTE